jgi:hypothetical protein
MKPDHAKNMNGAISLQNEAMKIFKRNAMLQFYTRSEDDFYYGVLHHSMNTALTDMLLDEMGEAHGIPAELREKHSGGRLLQTCLDQ